MKLTKDEIVDHLIEDDINDIRKELSNNNPKFLTEILMGNFPGYKNMSIQDLAQELSGRCVPELEDGFEFDEEENPSKEKLYPRYEIEMDTVGDGKKFSVLEDYHDKQVALDALEFIRTYGYHQTENDGEPVKFDNVNKVIFTLNCCLWTENNEFKGNVEVDGYAPVVIQNKAEEYRLKSHAELLEAGFEFDGRAYFKQGLNRSIRKEALTEVPFLGKISLVDPKKSAENEIVTMSNHHYPLSALNLVE